MGVPWIGNQISRHFKCVLKVLIFLELKIDVMIVNGSLGPHEFQAFFLGGLRCHSEPQPQLARPVYEESWHARRCYMCVVYA